MTQRNAYFLLAVTGSILIFWTPLRELLTFSLHDDTYSYIPLIPLISACLIYLERKRIFRDVRYGRACGAVFPITIFKNGLRIITLSFLLVRPRFSSFTTTLHKHAGIPFSLLAIALLLPIIWALRQLENRAGKNIPPPINL